MQLAKDDKARREAYRALFGPALDAEAIGDIRMALNQGRQLGNSRFRGSIEKATGQRSVVAGADFLVVCTNTMHKVVPAIEASVSIPLLHIADATAAEIAAAGHSVVGLLGTRFTMEQVFYRDRLSERHGLQVVVPDEGDRAMIHRIIYDELCLGVIRPESRLEYRRIMNELAGQGA